MAGVGDEEVPGRVERDPAGPVEDAGSDDGAHDRGRAVRRRARTRQGGQGDEPGQGHG